MRVSVYFEPREAELILRRAEFDMANRNSVTKWLHDLAVKYAQQQSWVHIVTDS
jgi:hypothetical protein